MRYCEIPSLFVSLACGEEAGLLGPAADGLGSSGRGVRAPAQVGGGFGVLGKCLTGFEDAPPMPAVKYGSRVMNGRYPSASCGGVTSGCQSSGFHGAPACEHSAREATTRATSPSRIPPSRYPSSLFLLGTLYSTGGVS